MDTESSDKYLDKAIEYLSSNLHDKDIVQQNLINAIPKLCDDIDRQIKENDFSDEYLTDIRELLDTI